MSVNGITNITAAENYAASSAASKTAAKEKDADFVIFDNNINVSYTILEGNVIYGN